MSTIAQKVITDLEISKVKWKTPVFIAIYGLPCAGKTEVAKKLESEFPLIPLTTDAIRLKYGLASGPDTHKVMYEVAGYLLDNNVGALFDCIHLGRKNREEAREFATNHHAIPEIVFVTASQETINKRLQKRINTPENTQAEGKFVITPEHFQQIASYLEPPMEDEKVWTIDTSNDSFLGDLEFLQKDLRKNLN